MSAKVFSFWTGQLVGPATLEMLESDARSSKRAAEQELMRQVDALVDAYSFTWIDLLPEDAVGPLVQGLSDAP